jgi:hypothetical protein
VCAKHAADGDVAGYTGWSTQLENAKLSSTYTKTSARTTPTSTVTMTSLTGQSCGLVTSAGLFPTSWGVTAGSIQRMLIG